MSKPRNWKIWFRIYEEGKLTGCGASIREYKHKSSATRRAKQLYGGKPGTHTNAFISIEWVVSQTNPWPDGVFTNNYEITIKERKDHGKTITN